MFIMIDGIDGSGKSTVLQSLANELRAKGKKVFFLKPYWAEYHRIPRAQELEEYDVIVSAEPTTVWVGAAIRSELIQTTASYSTHAIATAYSLDRLILYTRLIIPLRQQGKTILQDRGVSTSLCYQSVQDNPLPMADIATLEGNALALTHAPDHLVLTDIPAEVSIKRLSHRHAKQDDAMFEQHQFLARARERFLDPEYQSHFTSHGTRLHMLNGNQPLDIMRREAIQLFPSLFV